MTSSFFLSHMYRKVSLALVLVAGLQISCATGRKDDETSTDVGTSAQQGGTASGGQAGNANGKAAPQAIVTGAARYTLIGRFDSTKLATPTFNVAGSRVGVTFSGTSLTASVTDTGSDGFDVIIDGAQAANIQLDPTTTPTPITVASNLTAGQHTAWLIKRTEALQAASDGTSLKTGTITIADMTVDAGANFYTPPAGKARRIEAYGDSSFSGYGVDILCGDSSENSCTTVMANRYSPRTQDVLKSIPGAAAAALEADLVNVSFTGQGVTYGFYNPGNCNAAVGITTRCLPTISNEVFPPSAAPAYDFKDQADVVLMCAGGDDLDGAAGSGSFPAGADAFSQAYATWLKEIRTHYPKATIVVTLSPAARGSDITTLGNALQAAVSQAQAAQPGGTDADILYFNYYTGTNYTTYQQIAASTTASPPGLGFYYGGYGHPSAPGSAWLGQQLAKFVAQHKGWSMSSN